MPDVVLHGPSVSSAYPLVTPEEIADAVNQGLADKASADAVQAHQAQMQVILANAQQRLDILTTGVASANSQITSLQSTLTATQARVTALENHTPPPATPNAVASFSLGATTNTTQILNWTAPSSGVAVTFYDTKYKLAGASTWSNGPSVAVGTLTATVTGLTAGTSYDYSVVTRNAAGPGASSPTLTKATTNTSVTPSPAWTEITDNTGTITMANGDQVTIVNGVMKLNGANMATTALVNLALINNANVIYQRNVYNDWWYWVPSTASWTFTSDPRATPPPSTGGPGPGPAFQDLAGSFRDMGNGQRCSTGVTDLSGGAAQGHSEVAIKPYQWFFVSRGNDSGNFFAPITAGFLEQGRYLFLPDTPKIFSATGCPPLNPANSHITGGPAFISWWTAGNVSRPIMWGLYYEPGFDTAGDGQVYAVINDYKAGDSFHVSTVLAGRFVCRATSWGSILDMTGDSSNVPYGLGWVAFNNYNMTNSQILADWV